VSGHGRDHTSCRVDCLWSPGEDNVAVVDVRHHKGMHQCRSRLFTECTPDVSKTTKMVEAGRADIGSMFLETEVGSDDNSKHSNMLTWANGVSSKL